MAAPAFTRLDAGSLTAPLYEVARPSSFHLSGTASVSPKIAGCATELFVHIGEAICKDSGILLKFVRIAPEMIEIPPFWGHNFVLPLPLLTSA